MKNSILIFLIITAISCKDKYVENKVNSNEDVENLNKGHSELQSRNFTKAIEYFNNVINSTPITSTSIVTADCYIYRGVAKGELGDNRGAISDFSMVINNSNIRELKAQAYHMRGLGYLKINDYDSACSDLSKAGELGVSESYQLINDYCN
jgi:outer membrane protein assembly factor BamD (BamD/ComL family)